jgi:hypothetical protein
VASLGRSLVTTATEGTESSTSLTFEARTVQVHNLTASWLYVPDAGQPVPPFTYGAVLPLQGTSQARVSWATPSGITPATVGTGTTTFLWLEDALPPSNGQQVVIPSQQVACPITAVGTVVGAKSSAMKGATTWILDSTNGSTVTVDVALPTGANSIILDGGNAALGLPFLSRKISVQGLQSFTFYFSNSASTATPVRLPLAVVIGSGVDRTLRIHTAANGDDSLPFTFTALASFGTQAVSVQTNGQPLSVSAGLPPAAGLLTATNIGISPVAGSPAILIPDSPGLQNFIVGVGWTMNVTAAQQYHLQSTAGTNIYSARADLSNPPYIYFGLPGIPIASGLGVQISADTAASISLQGTLVSYQI